MPVLTKVEARSVRGRLFHLGVFVILIVAGSAMVYPFLLMLSGSMRSEMDESNMTLVPKYLTDKKTLVQKFLEVKYNFDPIVMNRFRQRLDYSFESASVPEAVNEEVVEDWLEFIQDADIPNHWQILGATRYLDKMRSVVLDEYIERVNERYNSDLNALNEDLGAPLRAWAHLDMLMPEWSRARYAYEKSPIYDEYFKLLHDRPPAERAWVNLTGMFLEEIIYPNYGTMDVERYNAAHAVPIKSYQEFIIPRRVPDKSQSTLRAEWLEFVLESLNPSFVKVAASNAEFQDFLKQEYGSVENLLLYWQDKEYTSFDQIKLPDEREWVFASQRQAYLNFLRNVPSEKLYLVGPEFLWLDHVKEKYQTVEALNAAYGTDYTSWEQCKMPIAQLEADYVYANSGMLRWRYASKNFRIVFNEIFVQGRAFYNTIIYVLLALMFSMTLQPLVAYSLSRYNPPGTWKFIFIFMATMAFPPMVAFIPQFLIIKKLNLLNTFVALVLPVTINGYLIFLLKGFFDSIPQHLYEAAMIEGASENYMFWHISMSLSKPILAVVALNTFRMAWMSFMYPLIVCPDEKMHVLSVWLHQFQMGAPTSAVFASILVASLPTLLIFIFAQRTIMKGIAVPAEK